MVTQVFPDTLLSNNMPLCFQHLRFSQTYFRIYLSSENGARSVMSETAVISEHILIIILY